MFFASIGSNKKGGIMDERGKILNFTIKKGKSSENTYKNRGKFKKKIL